MKSNDKPVYLLSLIIWLIVGSVGAAATSAEDNSDDNSAFNNVHGILSELEKISASLRSIGYVNSKLMSNLRANAMQYDLRCREAADIAKIGYNCASGIGCYKFNLSNLTWNEARKACRKDGARLAVINSENEAKVLRNLLLANYQFSAYVGIHNQFKEDEWVTVFGDPLAETGYNRWSVGPPKISKANCGVLFEDGKLLGIPCHVERSYFCEISGPTTC